MKKLLLGLLVAVWVIHASAFSNPQSEGLIEQVIETTPRVGVYQRAILSRKGGGKEEWLVISFPGYPGVLHIAKQDGKIDYELKGNFLVRARRHLVSEEIAVATLDCPSDQFSYCGDVYRSSEEHVRDVRRQVERLKEYFSPKIKIAILGTSYGTVSSEILANKLSAEIDAAIHTASITNPKTEHGMPLRGMDLGNIAVRQLLVHHQSDPCSLTPYLPLKKYENVLPIILVRGSDNARGPACEAFSEHGFVGRERLVMKAIGEWLIHNELTVPIE